MKFNKDWLNKSWINYSIAICIGVLFYTIINNLNILGSGIMHIFNVCIPIIYGVIIAYVLDPMVIFFQKKVFRWIKRYQIRRNLSITAVFLILTLSILFLIASILPQFFASIMTFSESLPKYEESIKSTLSNISGTRVRINTQKIERILTGIFDFITSLCLGGAQDVSEASINVGQKAFNFLLGYIIAIYLLASKKQILIKINNIAKICIKKNSHYQIAKRYWATCNSIMAKYIAFDLLDGCIVGIANAIFMSIMGMPYNILISVVCGVTNLMPTFGPLIGAIVGGFILLLANPAQAFLFIIFTGILQTIDGYILKPKLFGSSFNVPSVWILISIIVFGRMFHIAGILLAIPFAAMISYAIKSLKERKNFT